MVTEDFLYRISTAALGGFEAQKIYAPPYRGEFNKDEILAQNPRMAAVNILLYQKDAEWHFPLIVRSENERDRHSGQISLPGGKKEAHDNDFSETAIRETTEELGLPSEEIKLIREISPIYIPPSNFFVYAFLSYTKVSPQFTLQQGEAEELIELPLEWLKTLPAKPETLLLPQSRGVEVPVIPFGRHLIWGATSMILSEFSQLLKNV